MPVNKMKNTIVLKGISSNIVEEAIVALKPNVKIKQGEYNLKNKNEVKTNNLQNMILKEAEKVVLSYVETIKVRNHIIHIKNIKLKYKISLCLNIVFMVLTAYLKILN